ncbi:MAG: hypothetical protein ACHQF3_02810 [Alphaproteobacteria bacterium]
MAAALALIDAVSAKGSRLGFWKYAGAQRDGHRLKQILQEQGRKLTSEQLAAVVSHQKAQEDIVSIRRRFFVQCAISLAVLTFFILGLTVLDVSADSQKALCGLVGTVVGYWLR